MVGKYVASVRNTAVMFANLAAREQRHAEQIITPAVSVPTPAAAPAKVAMLHDALDQCATAFQETAVSDFYKSGVKDTAAAVKFYRAGCPLAEVDFAWLPPFLESSHATLSVCHHWLSH